MNVYYMNANLNDSEFPIVVWNTRVARNIKGVTQCPQGEYESKMTRWGEPEGMNLGADVGLASNNKTDRDRKDTFPVLLSDVMDKDEHL